MTMTDCIWENYCRLLWINTLIRQKERTAMKTWIKQQQEATTLERVAKLFFSEEIPCLTASKPNTHIHPSGKNDNHLVIRLTDWWLMQWLCIKWSCMLSAASFSHPWPSSVQWQCDWRWRCMQMTKMFCLLHPLLCSPQCTVAPTFLSVKP